LSVSLLSLQSCATSKSEYRSKRSVSRTSTPIHSKTKGSSRDKIIEAAQKYIGARYLYGGKDSKGFDCSGLVSRVFFDNKIDIRGNSASLSKQGKGKTIKDAKKGDLVFFKKGNRVNHVALVAEINYNELWVIHSTSSRGVIKENILASSYWSSKKYFFKDLL